MNENFGMPVMTEEELTESRRQEAAYHTEMTRRDECAEHEIQRGLAALEREEMEDEELDEN